MKSICHPSLEEIRISETDELWSSPVFSRWAEPPARNLTPFVALHHPYILRGHTVDIRKQVSHSVGLPEKAGAVISHDSKPGKVIKKS